MISYEHLFNKLAAARAPGCTRGSFSWPAPGCPGRFSVGQGIAGSCQSSGLHPGKLQLAGSRMSWPVFCWPGYRRQLPELQAAPGEASAGRAVLQRHKYKKR